MQPYKEKKVTETDILGHVERHEMLHLKHSTVPDTWQVPLLLRIKFHLLTLYSNGLNLLIQPYSSVFSILQAKGTAIWLPGSFPIPSDLWLRKYCASFRTQIMWHLYQKLSMSPSENLFPFTKWQNPFNIVLLWYLTLCLTL